MASLDAIQDRYRWVSVRFDSQQLAFPAASGVLDAVGSRRSWTVVLDTRTQDSRGLGATLAAEVTEDTSASLDEIFAAHVAAR